MPAGTESLGVFAFAEFVVEEEEEEEGSPPSGSPPAEEEEPVAAVETDHVIFVVEIDLIQPGVVTAEQGFFWSDGTGWTS